MEVVQFDLYIINAIRTAINMYSEKYSQMPVPLKPLQPARHCKPALYFSKKMQKVEAVMNGFWFTLKLLEHVGSVGTVIQSCWNRR